MKKGSIKGVERRLSQDEQKLEQVVEDFSEVNKSLIENKEEVGRLVKVLKETGFRDFMLYLRSPWHIIWSNLLGGIFRGLGIIIGMTLVFAILIWFLGKFVDFPLIGEYFSDLKVLLESFTPNNNYR